MPRKNANVEKLQKKLFQTWGTEDYKIIRSEHRDTDVRSKMRESLEIKWNHRREPWAGAAASSRVGRGEGASGFGRKITTTAELLSHTTKMYLHYSNNLGSTISLSVAS